jgi:hypothetical protein
MNVLTSRSRLFTGHTLYSITRSSSISQTRTFHISKCARSTGSPPATDYSHLRETLLSRSLPVLVEPLTYVNSNKLANSLSTFLPEFSLPYISTLRDHKTAQSVRLPPSWHLIHFNAALPADKLLPDGTDPAQSPGAPFVRRMWAGGELNFHQVAKLPLLDGQEYECRESIGSVDIKGPPGNEKVFVGIDRRIHALDTEDEIMHERRNIVFLQEQSNSAQKAAEPPRAKSSFGQPRSRMFYH